MEEMIAEERESSSAQIRTLLNEQRKTITAEYCEKVSHHELLAARAEQERRILQGNLLRQQQDFREVHQQNLTEMKELQKIHSSTFDALTRQKFIEDQNTIMELSGRLQELPPSHREGTLLLLNQRVWFNPPSPPRFDCSCDVPQDSGHGARQGGADNVLQ